MAVVSLMMSMGCGTTNNRYRRNREHGPRHLRPFISFRKDNRCHAKTERIGLRSHREGDQDVALKKL